MLCCAYGSKNDGQRPQHHVPSTSVTRSSARSPPDLTVSNSNVSVCIQFLNFYRPQRSCGQGYVFTRVCDSVHGGGGSASVHAGIPPGKETPPGRRHPPLPTIRSMSGRYASYWNAFLSDYLSL